MQEGEGEQHYRYRRSEAWPYSISIGNLYTTFTSFKFGGTPYVHWISGTFEVCHCFATGHSEMECTKASCHCACEHCEIGNSHELFNRRITVGPQFTIFDMMVGVCSPFTFSHEVLPFTFCRDNRSMLTFTFSPSISLLWSPADQG